MRRTSKRVSAAASCWIKFQDKGPDLICGIPRVEMRHAKARLRAGDADARAVEPRSAASSSATARRTGSGKRSLAASQLANRSRSRLPSLRPSGPLLVGTNSRERAALSLRGLSPHVHGAHRHRPRAGSPQVEVPRERRVHVRVLERPEDSETARGPPEHMSQLENFAP